MTNQAQLRILKGFRDFVGSDAKKRQWLITSIKRVFERSGFEPLETPTLEYEDLLLGKYGADAEKLMYRFEDNGGRKVALRYDQTVPTARVIAQYQHNIPFPFRRYQIQPVWRADKPQRGRYREFFQCDADIFGSQDAIADAEILAVFYNIFAEIGMKSIILKINDRQQLLSTVKGSGVDDEKVLDTVRVIDKLDKKTEDEVVDELERSGVKDGRKLLSKLSLSAPSENLQKIISSAIHLGIPESAIAFTPQLARGLDYYTGMIFEGAVPEYTAGSIGGGGRYDTLINDLVGIDITGVGFGLGFDRTLEAADDLNLIPQDISSSRVLVTVFNPDLVRAALETTLFLRSKDISTECFPGSDVKMEKQLKYADKKKIPFVVIVGPEEIAKKKILLKNMTTGEQRELELNEVINFV